jgi:DNA (cytosine-5)-methyltransferase 1
MTSIVDAQQLTSAGRASRRAVDIDRDFLRSRERPVEDMGGVQIVDLFSSLGGLTYGALEGLRRRGRAGCLGLAVDNEPAALGVLRETLGGRRSRFTCADLTGLLRPLANKPSRDERQLLGRVKPGSALLLAGPPCQGHSALNNHTRHDDPRNDLYLSVARAALLIDARAVVIENVQSVGSDRRRAAARCTAALEELGYEVTSRRLDLSRIGVPQTRVRHLLVATRECIFDWDLPEVVGRDVRWAIEDLLDLEGSSYIDSPSRATHENQRRIDWLFDNDAFDLPNRMRPKCHQSDHSYRSMYGRLRWDAPAQTVTSGFGSMGQGRYVHPLRRRTLTPHEAARLQCLPDYVQLPKEQRRSILATMIGNVAPPLLAVRLVEALIDQGLL